MTPDYVTTFEVWTNYPVAVGEVDDLGEHLVLELLPPLAHDAGREHKHRWIGKRLNVHEDDQ